MERYTKKVNDEIYIMNSFLERCEEGYIGDAATRLAQFEKMVLDLHEEQFLLSKKIEEYKLEGRAKSYQCRELMAKKLTNVTILNHLKQLGIIK